MREIGAGCLGLLGRLHAIFKEDLLGPPDQIPAALIQSGLAFPHLVPDAPEGVVGEELDHIAGREELVTERELVGVARGLVLLARLIPEFLRGEVLIDPADGLVLGPDTVEVLTIDEGKHLIEHALRRVDAVGRVVGVEEDADFLGERPTQPVEEVAVGHILLAGTVEPLVVRVIHQVEREPLGLHTAAHGLADETSSLHHLVGA